MITDNLLTHVTYWMIWILNKTLLFLGKNTKKTSLINAFNWLIFYTDIDMLATTPLQHWNNDKTLSTPFPIITIHSLFPLMRYFPSLIYAEYYITVNLPEALQIFHKIPDSFLLQQTAVQYNKFHNSGESPTCTVFSLCCALIK